MRVLTDGSVDFGNLRHVLIVMNDRRYWKASDEFVKAWDV
jgi:hypothetical protein